MLHDVTRGPAALRENGCGVAVRRCVLDLERFIDVAGTDDHENRSEDFVLRDSHVGRDVVYDRRADEISLLLPSPLHHGASAIHQHFRAGRFGFGDVGLDALPGGGRDHRADIASWNDGARVLDHPFDDVVGRRHRDHHRRGHAALARASGHRGDDVARRHLLVGVGHHDQVILRATESETALQRRGRAPVDDLRDLGRSDEADRGDSGVVADRLDGFLPTVNDLQNAFGQPRFLEQLGDSASAERNELRRLEDEAVSERDRVGNRPVRNHVREVEGRDRRDDPKREPLDPALHTAAHLEHFSRRDLRQRAGELAQLGRLQDLSPGFARDLAVLLGYQRGQLVDVLLEQCLVAVEDLGALLDRRRGPSGERLGGAGDRRIDVIVRREWDPRDDTAVARVVHFEEGALAADERAVQIVADFWVFHASSILHVTA